MHKTEPKIVAPGYTDEEIYEWMTKKLAAINQLREVLSYRQETIDSLKNQQPAGLNSITDRVQWTRT